MDYSPILAVATAAFEIIVAGRALSGLKRAPGERRIVWTTGAILLLLAAYQLAEVAICSDVAMAGFLPRLAFVIVTWLPPLGLLLIAQLRYPRSRLSDRAAYAMLAAAAAIVAWIVVDRSFATASVCNAVYARYTHAMPRFRIYAWFYWLGLAAMAALSGRGAMTCRQERRRRQLAQVFAGTTGFVGLSMLTSWFVEPAPGALPSIMCHFALLLAICLARVVQLERRTPAEASGTIASQAG